MRYRLGIILAGVLVALESQGNAQTPPRVTIATGTQDALLISSFNNHSWRVGPNSGAGAGFGVYDDTAALTRLKIDLNGFVGIGTSNPMMRLDVAGPIRSESGGFVFPDGTSQLSAATGGYSAGAGLALNGNVLMIANDGVTHAMLTNGSVASSNIAPSAVQTANIADGAVTSQKLAPDLVSGVQQVVRGVISFSGMTTDVEQSFSPSIDPTKSYVIIGTPVYSQMPSGTYWASRLGATLVALTANRITVAVDYPQVGAIYPCRVSFQIIQFK